MLSFNDSRCESYYTNISIMTSNSTYLNNPILQSGTLYYITPINQFLDMDYSFSIIVNSTGPFTDVNGIL